jgi:hypothetical protein
MRSAVRRNNGAGNQRHRWRQPSVAHHRQGQQAADRSAVPTSSGRLARVLDDPQEPALAFSQHGRQRADRAGCTRPRLAITAREAGSSTLHSLRHSYAARLLESQSGADPAWTRPHRLCPVPDYVPSRYDPVCNQCEREGSRDIVHVVTGL